MEAVEMCSECVRQRGYLVMGSWKHIRIGTILGRGVVGVGNRGIDIPFRVVKETSRADYQEQCRVIDSLYPGVLFINPYRYYYVIETD
jgi:hypothetical protein